MLANNKAEAVDMFKVFLPSPPVPHVSTQLLALTLLDLFLRTYTPPAISLDTSPLADSRVKKLNISSSKLYHSLKFRKRLYFLRMLNLVS
tara:strand:+ start:415 stop:684 length:270 start_codon:yes stop_codon:yes gene_type:complete